MTPKNMGHKNSLRTLGFEIIVKNWLIHGLAGKGDGAGKIENVCYSHIASIPLIFGSSKLEEFVDKVLKFSIFWE